MRDELPSFKLSTLGYNPFPFPAPKFTSEIQTLCKAQISIVLGTYLTAFRTASFVASSSVFRRTSASVPTMSPSRVTCGANRGASGC